jgi:hypothetical protein
MLRCAPRGAQRKTRGRVDRYSFLVRIFHPLLPAGLSRRFQTSAFEVCGLSGYREKKPADLKAEVRATWSDLASARPGWVPKDFVISGLA